MGTYRIAFGYNVLITVAFLRYVNSLCMGAQLQKGAMS